MRNVLALATLSVALVAAAPAPGPAPAGLTFTHVSGSQGESVSVATATGSHAREVARNAMAGMLSADGRWLIYQRLAGVSAPGYPLVVRNLETGATRPLGSSDAVVRWAPSGPRLALATGSALDLVDAATGRRTRLVTGRVSSFDFDPDGKSIVFALSNGRYRTRERSDLFRIRIADRALTQLTFDGHSEGPRVSRAGIAFVRFLKEEDAQEVWTMRGDGSYPRLVTRCCLHRDDRALAGQPLGYQIVDVSTRGDHLVLCRVTSEGCESLAVDLRTGRRHWIIANYTVGVAVDLSADGNSVLLSEGPFHDAPGHFRLYSVPFTGGRRTLVKWNAADGRWRG